MGIIFSRLLAATLLAALLTPALADEPARPNDFPTIARVEFVLDCMKNSKAPVQEMVYKCSCAVDHVASKISYETWVDLATVSAGTTIAGERGGEIRDMKDGRKMINTYRDLQAQAKRACFIKD